MQIVKTTELRPTNGHAVPAPPTEIPPANDAAAVPLVATPVAEPAKSRGRAPLVFGALAALAVVGATSAYFLSRGHETTDDAFVEGHVANVAARVAGQVEKVLVTDNQRVVAGDPLIVLDPRDQNVKLDVAKADLTSAQAQLEAAQAQLALTEQTASATIRQAQGGVTQASAFAGSSVAQVAQAKADVEAAESRSALATLDYHRAQKLVHDGAASPAEYDAKKALFDQAQASLAQARARYTSAAVGIDSARGNTEAASGRLLQAKTAPQQVGVARAQVGVARARVLQAEATLAQAELNVSYMTIRAPQAGIVARRTVELGQMVDPARPLLSIVSVDDSWVVANFKEDQIAALKPNQKVDFTVDAYPGVKLQGHVESLAGGTGARFALLPPDNASGNFTKVVQRVPVLIRLDGNRTIELRPGMSVAATIHTGS